MESVDRALNEDNVSANSSALLFPTVGLSAATFPFLIAGDVGAGFLVRTLDHTLGTTHAFGAGGVTAAVLEISGFWSSVVSSVLVGAVSCFGPGFGRTGTMGETEVGLVGLTASAGVAFTATDNTEGFWEDGVGGFVEG